MNGQFEKGKISEGQYRAFQREVAAAEQQLSKLEAQAIKSNAVLSKEDAVNNLKKIGLAAGAAALAVGAMIGAMAGKALEQADGLQRLSDVTGLSAERLQELQYAGSNLGVELETITGAQAKLTKAMFASRDGTGSQADAFAALGLSVTDANGGLRDVKDVMAEAFTALNGVGSETERDALAMQLFGKSAMALNPLIKAGGDELNRLGKEARDSGAIMSDEAVAALDTFGDTLENVKTAIMGGVGEALAGVMPNLLAFLEGVKELPQWLADNKLALELAGTALGTVTGLVIAFNIQQALLASGLTLWTWAAGIAAGVTGALGTAFAFLTGPVGLAILAIGALVAAGVLVYRNWEEIKAALSNVWEAVAEFFTVRIPAAIETGLAFFAALPEKIAVFLNELPGKIGYALGFALGMIVKFGSDAIVWAVAEVPRFIGEIIRFYSELPGKLWEWLSKALDKVKEWGVNLISWAKTNLPVVINTITGYFSSLPQFLFDTGVQMIKGLWNGIVSLKDWLYEKVMDFIDGLIEGVNSALGMSSPSKVFAGIGENVSLGLAQGIESAAGMVERSLGGLLSTMNVQASVALAGSGAGGATYNSGGNVINISVTDGDDLLRTLARLGVVI